jgi:tetratricopeptide (TPR) repeat protein
MRIVRERLPDVRHRWSIPKTMRRSNIRMNRVRLLLLLTLLSATVPLAAQTDAHQQLGAAASLVWQGRVEEAIKLAKLAAESKQISEIDRGKAWTVLGSAYQNQGRFQEAMTAYESAIHILKGRDDGSADYASALSAFGTLFRDMRQFDAASQMELRALHVDEQIGDHAGIALVCASLADLELGLNHERKAQHWLDEAIHESRLTPSLSADFYAFVTSSQAWLAESNGNARAAVAGFQREIEYLTSSHGEENPQVGWAYMLLGKAQLRSGDAITALEDMGKGSAILRKTVGIDNPRYLLAQLEYADALNSAGRRAEAAQIKDAAETRLRVFENQQCPQCRITAMALH